MILSPLTACYDLRPTNILLLLPSRDRRLWHAARLFRLFPFLLHGHLLNLTSTDGVGGNVAAEMDV